jgi:glycosyltransferase involved in cell wall biosynthesis
VAAGGGRLMARVLFVANWDWVLAHFRLPLARRLRKAGYEVVLCCPPGEHIPELREAGFGWIPWGLERRSMGVGRELRALSEIAQAVDDVDPDVVHAFTIKPVVYLSVVVAWRSLRRRTRPRVLINNLTGLGYLFSAAGTARAVRALLWPLLMVGLRQPRAQAVLMNDGDRRRLARARLLRAGRTELIRGTGVDTALFTPAGGTSPTGSTTPSGSVVDPSGPATVLFAARLLASKGVGDYVEAARRLTAELGDVAFLVAGTPDVGNPDAVPPETIRRWHDEGVARWLGDIEDMSALLAEVDVLVVPTFYPEGIPRILLEGAAAGCGLVAGDTDGCREVIDHGRNGLLVPPRDPHRLAAAIRQLLEEPCRREKMATEARRDAVERFDLVAINDQWAELYRRVLERAGVAGEA